MCDGWSNGLIIFGREVRQAKERLTEDEGMLQMQQEAEEKHAAIMRDVETTVRTVKVCRLYLLDNLIRFPSLFR